MDWIYDQTLSAIARVVGTFLSWGHGLHYVYLASALAIAVPILWMRRRARSHGRGSGSGQRPRRSFLAELLPGRIWLHPSCRRDYWILLLNSAVFFFFSASTILAPSLIAALFAGTGGAGGAGGIAPAPPSATLAWQILFSLYMLLAWDFFATFSHYLKHRLPLLWEFHKVHHSAEAMTPVTNYRRHPIDFMVSSFIIIVGTGAALGLWLLAFGPVGPVLSYLGMPVALGIWYLLGYNLRHSHVWIGYGPFWSRVFISPAQHQIHHSRDPRHYDCNFGLIFAFWDRLFGTLYIPERREQIRLGLTPAEMGDYRSLRNLYIVPFVKAGRMIGRALGRQA